ncbi:MFS transporter [Flaviaesturariibacter amylovorans]|uniref:MFS transporter n=1 Tax=Flaviaesturariibacter amylovorans TaxID=1084520 RepID=A0ABP8GGZ5_9BACT
MAEQATPPHSLAPLYVPEFRIFLIARFFYTMSLRMVGTVVAYQLYQLTRDSFAIGISGLAEFVPVVLLALYAGYLIDRSDKRTLLLKGICSYSLCVAALVVLTLPQVQESIGSKTLPLFFYAVIFFTGVIRAFAGPTSSAIIAQLVPRNILHLASAVSSSTFLISSIVGHASAGFFIAAWGVHVTFIIILGYVLLAALLISFIAKKPVMHTTAGVRAWDSVKEGLRFVVNNKVMLGAMSLDLFAVLFGGAVALIPEIADRILSVGPKGFGFLNAAIDIGAATTLLFNTFFPLRRKQGTILMFAVFGFGGCIVVFGLSSAYWMAFTALLVAGMLDGISVVIRGTILQLTTPDQMRGRVSSVNSMFINSSNELGYFESGFTARLMGPVRAVIFGGCMTMLVVLLTWWRAPGLRKFEY